MANPTYRASTTYNSGGSNTANVSFTVPAAVQVGDFLFVDTHWGAGITPATVTGWTLRVNDQTSNSVLSTGVYWKFAEAGDLGATVNFPLSTGASRQGLGLLHAYYNVDPTTPFDTTDTAAETTAGGDPDAADNTSVSANALALLVVIIYFTSQASATTATTPTGWTVRASTGTTASSARKQVWLYEKQLGAAGVNTGPVVDISTNPQTWQAFHLLLRGTSTSSGSGTAAGSFSWAGVAESKHFTYPVNYPVFVAHRGGPGPEETLETYRRSYAKSPSYALESDMQLLSTGESVLMHDTTIDRTASGTGTPTTGSVSALTLTQWRTSRVADLDGTGVSPQPPGELINIGAEYGGPNGKYRLCVLEVKAGSSATHCGRIVDLGLADRTIVCTSTRADAQAARDRGLEVMFQTNIPNYTNLAADGVKHLSVGSGSIDAAFCTTAHSNGVKVWAYTPNTTTDRDTLLAAGVDGFFTDVPSTLGEDAGQGTAAGTYSYVGAATGRRTANGTAAGSFGFAGGSATGVRAPKATGTGSFTFVGAAVGKRPAAATAAGSYAYVGAAVGKRPAGGTASGSWAFVGAATGVRAPKGTGTGNFTWAGVAIGNAPGENNANGFASGAFTWAGAATGKRAPVASATGNFTWTGAATGTRAPKATAAGSYAYVGAAVGAAPTVPASTGTATGGWGFAGAEATGHRAPKATVVGAYAYVGVALGKRAPKATATAGTFTWTGHATGSRPPEVGDGVPVPGATLVMTTTHPRIVMNPPDEGITLERTGRLEMTGSSP